MDNLHDPRFISKCVLSDSLAPYLQLIIGLLEAEWQRIRHTMDPHTEVLLRQAHEALAKLYDALISSTDGRHR
jgi:hypothetical protein